MYPFILSDCLLVSREVQKDFTMYITSLNNVIINWKYTKNSFIQFLFIQNSSYGNQEKTEHHTNNIGLIHFEDYIVIVFENAIICGTTITQQ